MSTFAQGGAVARPATPLSESQQKIYDLIARGQVKSISDIAGRTGTDSGVVHAQITRILGRGQWHDNMRSIKDIRLPNGKKNLSGGNAAMTASEPTPSMKPNAQSADGPVTWEKVRRQPVTNGGPSNDSIINEAMQGGPAMSFEDLAKTLQEKMPAGSLRPDMQPMILLGVALQFMKLAGGRLSALQLIEDTYGALAMLVNGGVIPPLDFMRDKR